MRILAGYLLQFFGMGLVVASLVLATLLPEIPFGYFIALAVVLGVPPIALGGRWVFRGRYPKGTPVAEVERDYQFITFRFACYLGAIIGFGVLLALPAYLALAGLIPKTTWVLPVWWGVLLLLFSLARQRIIFPLLWNLERLLVVWWFKKDLRKRS